MAGNKESTAPRGDTKSGSTDQPAGAKVHEPAEEQTPDADNVELHDTTVTIDAKPPANEDDTNNEQTQSTDNKYIAQYEEMRDKYLRLSAEFDNYRKRTLREKAEMLKYASEDTLRDLLPVVDDLDRAIIAIETATELNAVREGMTLIVNKFNDFLKTKGVKEIDAMGLELDTDHHEAVTKAPTPDKNLKGKIIDVIQKGYTINDKVMRFAKVVIGE